MHRLSAFVVALALVLLVPAAGADGATPAGESLPQDPAIDWERCHGDAQCAVLAVPLDYTLDDGPTIDIALVRYRAQKPAKRIGALLMNPGGPGASGVDYVVSAARSLPSELQDRFDIVGFDPRGAARSRGVDCTDDLDPYFDAEWAPDDAGERRELLNEARALVAACERSDADLLPFLATKLTARDMDRIRDALDEPKLTYVGYSYGAYLGAWYAQLFPKRVRALVLDGPLDPKLDAAAVQVQQAVGFERVLDDFFESCSRRPSCDFHRDGHTADAYDRLRARIGDEPLPVESDGEPHALNGTRFDLAVTQLLYEGDGNFGELASSLAAADRGDGSDLLFYADFYTGRIDDDDYENSQEAFLAIGCGDGPSVGGVNGMREIERLAEDVAPRLGRSIVNGSLPCAFWPVTPAPPRALRGVGASAILVLGTRHDPATPFRWAEGLTKQLDSGVLVSVRGSRHTSFDGGNKCVDDLVVRYLVRLEVPEEDTRC